MKTYKHLLEQIADKDNVRKAILNASKRKRHRKDVKQVIDNIDYHVEVVHNMLLTGSYKAHVDAPCIVNEGTHHKVRRMISYMGYIKHTDCYGTYRDYIRQYVNIGKLKKFTSKRAKKGALKNGVEKSDRNADNTASSTRPRQQP